MYYFWINNQQVFGRLPHQILVGYPYQIDDYSEYLCIPRRGEVIEAEGPVRDIRKRSLRYYPYYYRSKNDAYSSFKVRYLFYFKLQLEMYVNICTMHLIMLTKCFQAIGIKIITNSDVKEPTFCASEYAPFINFRGK